MRVTPSLAEDEFRAILEAFDAMKQGRIPPSTPMLRQAFQRLDQAGAEYIKAKARGGPGRPREGVVPFPILVGVLPPRE